ncbi:hypothetical protein [Thioalkalivibrio paradoxus]|uniref:Porin n=1 Tax=Thioalkalivibrio paradoxus ARh 1 TaxID=713585 RepID=W0DNU5_9GAMM|nr:hypothetical protein [Thioalkalivibrio paradoxus]AHE98927.1 hypothetical protein THITH_12385 [Thioalkalivibrio paradoxus ARh 1]
MRKWILGIAVGLSLAVPVLADAPDDDADEIAENPVELEGDPDVAVPRQPEDDGSRREWLETTRRGVDATANWLVRGVDGWFGDKPFDESGGEVSGSIYVRGLQREDEGFKARVRFRLDVTMPNVDERAFVFLGRDNEAELVTDQPDTFRRSQLLLPESRTDDSTFFAGVGYFLRDNVSLRAGVRGGYKLYGQARYQKGWWLTEQSRIEFTETIFLAVSDGLGSTTALDYGYAFADDFAFRWRNSATISTETDGFAWATALGTLHTFPEQRELSFDLLANGETGYDVSVREYGVRGIYRRPVYRDWLLGEVIVGYFWPREDDDPDRREAWAVGLAAEMRF